MIKNLSKWWMLYITKKEKKNEKVVGRISGWR
jgi:hypothetical protein